ncbi:alcohol dehydrogenase catalytic domain-containing protein [Streptococcus gallolyticus subsp. gallolyticus]|uniref:alcohol dehydrogenase catalytic domain-containing protein n=1 Tax=Streptococcus gallolyticus TaxID=315405 RepID=UPI0022844B4A|nr:alcohol dehydrogenase catalytic domain-containing protein [Streptococcus gallolyticus]MCY7201300.1 alcohol dehydrogenase catalytic domain-containing protein [Streptococcus gallolyticus subsp. gallolyticus]
MKSAIFEKAGLMTVEEVAKPTLQADDDVIIKVVRACVCGSDLWSYANGDEKAAHSENSGHEALGVIHNGGRVGFVGVPHYNNRPLGSTFAQNITVGGGSASVTTYDKQLLLKAVLDGDINPGRVFTNTYRLDDINQAYKDMQDRKAIKSMIVMD